MEMDIFSTRIRSIVGPNDVVAVNSKSGRFKILKSLNKKILSTLSPEQREKFFGIKNEALPVLIAGHKVSSQVEQAILDDNIDYFIEKGFFSNETSREKLREIVVKAMDNYESSPPIA